MASSTKNTTEPRRARARNHVVLACATAVTLTFGLHGIAPALPVVQDVFGLDDFQIGLVTSAYVLPGVFLAVPLGVLADLIGRRPVYVASSILYGVMGLAQSTAGSFEMLLVWRLGQGIAFAALMPLTVTVIGDALSGVAQIRGQAQRQVSMAVSNLVVPILGAQLALVSWSWPFAIQSIAVIPGVAALVVLGDVTRRNSRSGYLGKALRSLAMGGYPSILALGFIRFVARFSLLAYLPIHLTRNLGISLPVVGVVMGVTVGLGFASALVTARLSRAVAPSRIVTVALGVMGVGVMGFAWVDNVVLVFVVAVLYGLADGFISVLQSAYAARGTPDDVRAGLVAVNGTARNAGKFVGPVALGALATWFSISVGFVAVGMTVIATTFLVVPGLARTDSQLNALDDPVTGR